MNENMQAMIDQVNEIINRDQAAIDSYVESDNTHIVMIGELAMSFDAERRNVKPCLVTKATRMPRELAESICRNVINGRGDKGTAIAYLDALHKEIQTQKGILELPILQS